MMTRDEYMSDSNKNYNAYYSQFVCDRVRAVVKHAIGEQRILQSTDFFMNDIPVQEWEGLENQIKQITAARVTAAKGYFDIYVAVSIAKAAARELRVLAGGEALPIPEPGASAPACDEIGRPRMRT